MQEVTTEMIENGIDNMEWIDRVENENTSLGTERCKNIDTLYINKNYYFDYYYFTIFINLAVIT